MLSICGFHNSNFKDAQIYNILLIVQSYLLYFNKTLTLLAHILFVGSYFIRLLGLVSFAQISLASLYLIR